MANDPVRVAAVGLGRWAKVLAEATKRSDRLRLVNCFSRSDKSRDAFAQQFGCRKARSYEELLDDPEVEGLIITTPNDAHADPIIKAAEKGKTFMSTSRSPIGWSTRSPSTTPAVRPASSYQWAIARGGYKVAAKSSRSSMKAALASS